MDDRRFDSLVKSLASGGNRRSMLKGMLGLGGAAVATSVLSGADTLAARRPDPTPKPVKCPGQQTPSGSDCICVSPPAPGTHKCGPDCCTGLPGDSPSPTHSECCDNACCYGTCYGEELCCPTNPPAGGGPATHKVCDGLCINLTEDECCVDSDCGESGTLECIDHLCVEPTCPTGEIECGADCCVEDQCVTGQGCCPDGFVACGGSCCNTTAHYCDEEEQCSCLPGTEECSLLPGGCCPDGQCNVNEGICCESGTTPCGSGENACCDTANQFCNGQFVCVSPT